MWEVEVTDEWKAWFEVLTGDEQEAVTAVVELLQEGGPGLRRPIVGHISGSRHANMRELIPPGGFIRTLFCFDPRRTAILLIGGDKYKKWDAWYEEAIPVADDLYDAYLDELRAEGLLDATN